ncbi:MAG: DUF2219 family protein [Bacteroidetes bacterium]|nr:DUF2219 family protein [Bacteroidota bacterium]HET6243882.1 lipid A-modifier LpxR family protein [Bacteroidia bacterium]
MQLQIHSLFIVLFSYTSFSQEVPKEKKSHLIQGFRLDFEQDFLLEYMGFPILNSDRNYTQGAGVTLFLKPSQKITNCLFSNFSQNGSNFFYPAEFSLQLGAFTPNELRDPKPIIGDRPYSTLVMLGIKNSLMIEAEKKLVQKGLYLGILGIDGPARDLQTKIHKGMNEFNTKSPFNPMGVIGK